MLITGCFVGGFLGGRGAGCDVDSSTYLCMYKMSPLLVV